MAITTAVPTAAKDDMVAAFPSGHTYKMILLAVGATLGASATTYAALAGGTELAAGGGYTAGGATLSGYTRTTSGTTVFVDFSDPQWTSATFSTDGCAIVDTTTDRIVYVGAFGSTKSVTAGTFTVQLPTADASNAILRAA